MRGGTSEEVIEEEQGDRRGRMRDGESKEASEEAAIAWEGRKDGRGNVTFGRGEKGVGMGS